MIEVHRYTPSLKLEPRAALPWLCYVHLPEAINNRAALRVAGRAALQQLLTQPIVETEHGPRTAGFALSVSYAADVCLLGIFYGANLGVDIVDTTALENWSPLELDDVAALYFSKATQTKYKQATHKAHAFAQHWAAFESQAKASQKGIAQHLSMPAKTWMLDGLPVHLIGAASIILNHVVHTDTYF